VADLVTHLAVVLLPAGIARWRLAPVAAFGAALPDLLGRAVPLGLERLYAAGAPVPMALLWPWSSLHEPLGWALASTLFATAFVERDRRRVLLAAWLGGAAHTALDVLQDHRGEGYLLLVPLSSARFELGWIGSEATVAWAEPLAAWTAVAWVGALRGPWRLPLLGGATVLAAAMSGSLAGPAWAAGALLVGAISARPRTAAPASPEPGTSP
jgi:hypothetical protein